MILTLDYGCDLFLANERTEIENASAAIFLQCKLSYTCKYRFFNGEVVTLFVTVCMVQPDTS